MRAAIGLVGLLVGVGILMMLYASSTPVVTSSGVKAQEEVRQLAGQSRDGTMRFSESIALEPSTSGGKTVALIVLSVDAVGPAATHFGLQRDDMITAIGPLSVKDHVTSGEEGVDYLTDAYQRQQTITVIRNDQTITLPGGAGAAAAVGTTPAAGTPGAQPQPAAPAKDDRGSLQRQLDAIQGAGQRTGGN
jgi:hypothetical protein